MHVIEKRKFSPEGEAVVKEESIPARKLKGTPLGTNLLVVRLDNEEEKNSLIIRPDVAKQKSDEARVISVGPEVQDVQPGEHILIRRFAGVGTEIMFNGREHLIINRDEVLLKLAEDAA